MLNADVRVCVECRHWEVKGGWVQTLVSVSKSDIREGVECRHWGWGGVGGWGDADISVCVEVRHPGRC